MAVVAVEDAVVVKYTTKTYILLFRGINVGGRNLLPMKELKTFLEAEGYSDISTYIQSGNVVLNAGAKPHQGLSLKLDSQFGFKPKILVLDKTELLDAVDSNPYSSSPGNTIHFYFCMQKPELDQNKIESFLANDESYTLNGSVFYLNAPSGIGRSKLVANIEACLATPATGRNLNTVQKLKKMVESAS